MNETIRRLAVVLAVVVAIGIPSWQAISGFGQSASEFSSEGDSTLRVAGYAFSIWSIIYAGLAAYALRRLVRRSGKIEAALDWPLAAAALGCGLWIVAAALDQRWISVLVIFASAAAATTGLTRVSRAERAFTWTDRLTAVWPIALLAGWLTIASAVNLLTVLTAEGVIPPEARLVALAAVVVTALVAGAVLLLTRSGVYAVPVIWGLVGAYVAERGDAEAVAWTALACAAALALTTIWLIRRPGSPTASRAR